MNWTYDVGLTAIRRLPMVLDVEEPPCKLCKHWSPRVKTDEKGDFAGIVCCTADEQYRDFSCYRDREPKSG